MNSICPLTPLGACALEAANAAATLATLDHTRANLVILDYHLPGTTGLDLARTFASGSAAPPSR